MGKGIFVPGTSNSGVPAALLAYRLASGRVRAVAVSWLGVVSSSPAVITLCCMAGEKARPEPGRDFTVCLPAEEILHRPGFVEAVRRGEDPLVAAGLNFVEGEAPLLAGCPVQIECRRRENGTGFGPDLIYGEVTALRIDGRIRRQARPGDMAGLARSLAAEGKRPSGPTMTIPGDLLRGGGGRDGPSYRTGEAGSSSGTTTSCFCSLL